MKNVKQLTHRQRQALVTQKLIIDNARDLFLEQSYGLTTIEAISARAGVAVSTVYAIFKNKRAILRAIREDWHLQSEVRSLLQVAGEEADPQKRMVRAAHATRRQWETGAAIVRIYNDAASVDAEAAAELQEALQGRRAAIERLVQDSLPMLRDDLSVARATAIYLALTRVEIYQELIVNWGWQLDEYELWLAKTLTQQLLPPSARE